MRRNISLLACCSLLLAFAACSQNENATKQSSNASTNQTASVNSVSTPDKSPPADVVRAEASNLEIKAGGAGEASVKLTIADGYHINANPPSFSYLKATELTAEPSGGITPGKPVYPSAVSRKFAFSKDGPLNVYEGAATIKLPLKAASDVPKGAHTLTGKLRIQACDQEACYPPRTIETQIPVTVN